MEFVCNANFKGDFNKNINLIKLSQHILNSKLCLKPFQLVIKDPKGTLLLFSNGKFRIMGCIDELEASFLPLSYIEKVYTNLSISFPSIILQSYTLKCDLGFHVNLEKMRINVPCIYEPELFPALRIKQYMPISVNIFATGKVIVCGLKEPNEMYDIQENVKRLSEPYKI